MAGGLFPSPLGFGLGSFFLARLVCFVPARGLPGIGKVCWNKILLGESTGEPGAPFVGVVGPGVYPRVGGGTFPRDERLTMVIFAYTKIRKSSNELQIAPPRRCSSVMNIPESVAARLSSAADHLPGEFMISFNNSATLAKSIERIQYSGI